MARKQSIYISTAAENVIGDIPPRGNLSGRINSIVCRYGEIIKDCPILTAEEQKTIIETISKADPQSDIIKYLWAELLTAEHKKLSDKIRGMTYAQICAVIESTNS